MYIRIVFEDLGEIPAIIEKEEYYKIVEKSLPVKSEARVWKEEVYFSTGIDLSGKGVSRIRSGRLAYWPPEKSMCLFAWSNQPYGRVIRLGWFLGPKHYVLEVEDGMEVRVEKPSNERYSEELIRAVEKLRSEGFYVAPRVWEDGESIVGASIYNGRVGFEIFVEDFGFIAETDPLYYRDFSAQDEAYRRVLKRLLKSRVDVNEENYVILSTFAETLDDLVLKLKRLVVEYRSAERILGQVLG